MVTVIIPTYNEQLNIEPLIQRLAQTAPGVQEPLEVLIVDGASTDGTAEGADRRLSEARLGRVISLNARGDLSSVVIEGMRQANGDLLAVMDADLSHPPELLPMLVRAVRRGADVAVASRYVRGGSVAKWPWHRRCLSRLGSLAAYPLTRVRDPLSGYFVCRAALIHQLAWQPTGFKMLLELLVRARPQRIVEVPYQFTDRKAGTSKLHHVVLWRFLAQLVRLYRTQERSSHVC